ncbi:MAG: hypothetical protein U9N78_09785 [Actinomycetota bacterium]|nr:hypothetical protein [Actinomycetota bacterium]
MMVRGVEGTLGAHDTTPSRLVRLRFGPSTIVIAETVTPVVVLLNLGLD